MRFCQQALKEGHHQYEKCLMQNTILLCIFLYPYTLFPNVVVFASFFLFQRFVEKHTFSHVYDKYIIVLVVIIISAVFLFVALALYIVFYW